MAGIQADAQEGLPWWVWLIIILLAILIVWWLISRQSKYSPPADLQSHEPASAPDTTTRSAQPLEIHTATPLRTPAPEPIKPDDLAIIEGIGPKINSVLQAAGITTFNQLAGTEISRLQEILNSAGYRINDPTTWPEQARMAAGGDWEGLEKLQSTLKAGRSTG
jgi:predicted flap endonuclease-1-like 5' DNA nuclease